MTQPTLYFSPGACSLAPHVVLEEVGAPYEARLVSIREGAHRKPEYLRINPRGRVPALETGGQVLTEVAAILTHLADAHPDAGLLPPPGDLQRARAHEWMSFLGSWVHIAYAQLWRAERFSDEEVTWPAIRQSGRATVVRFTAEVDALLEGRTWALGERYSVVDPYLLVFYVWAWKEQLPVRRHVAYTAHLERMLQRPAVLRAMRQEGMPVDALTSGR